MRSTGRQDGHRGQTAESSGELDGRIALIEAHLNGLSAALAAGDQLPPPALRRHLAAVARIRRTADALVVSITARLRRSGSPRHTAEVVAHTAGVTGTEARRLVGLAERLPHLGPTRAALADGTVSVAEASVIAEVAEATGGCPATEDRLLRIAAAEGLDVLRREAARTLAVVEPPEERARRQHATRSLRCWTGVDGMLNGRFALTPEAGAEVRALIEARTRRRFRAVAGPGREPIEAYAADALVELVRAGGAGAPVRRGGRERTGRGDDDGSAAGESPEQHAAPGAGGSRGAGRRGRAAAAGVRPVVHIVIEHAALVRGAAGPGERCEVPGVGPVDAAWVRDLLGEAFVTAIIRKGRDIRTVAHLGRHIPAELHSALVARGRECDVEGCARASYLELDHCDLDHARGGPTSLANLAWLCWDHHRRKTAGARLGPRNPVTGKRPLIEGRGPP
jgi:hypothetical protein